MTTLPNGKIYVTKGDQFIRYSDRNADEIDAGYPRPIAGHWGDLPAAFNEGFDAMTTLPNGKTYVTKGDQVIRYSDKNASVIDAGYPQPIAGHWGDDLPAAFNEGFDAMTTFPPRVPQPGERYCIDLHNDDKGGWRRLGYAGNSNNELEFRGFDWDKDDFHAVILEIEAVSTENGGELDLFNVGRLKIKYKILSGLIVMEDPRVKELFSGVLGISAVVTFGLTTPVEMGLNFWESEKMKRAKDNIGIDQLSKATVFDPVGHNKWVIGDGQAVLDNQDKGNRAGVGWEWRHDPDKWWQTFTLTKIKT